MFYVQLNITEELLFIYLQLSNALFRGCASSLELNIGL